MIASSSNTELGFVGLGIMGSMLTGHLLKFGCKVHVYDTNPVAIAKMAELGATPATSPKAVADAARIVFACLPSTAASLAVALGDDGIIHGKTRAIYIEMSTSGEEIFQQIDGKLKAAGVAMLDVPVSGGVLGGRNAAQQGKLTTMVAGPQAAIDEARPYLKMFSQQIFEIGSKPGQAQLMKLLNNTVGAAGQAAAFEAMVLGVKAGLDPNVMVDVMNASSGRNTATEDKIPNAILTRTFDTGGRIGNRTKEFKLILAEAERLGVPMWVSAAVAQLYNFAATQGGLRDDTTTLIKYIEKWAGVEVRGKAPQ